MDQLRVPKLGWIVVGDGRKTLFLRNDGTADTPRLSTVQTLQAPDNPRASDQGSERRGRVVSSTDGRRSGVEQRDHHTEQEISFARHVAGEIGVLCADRQTKWVAVVAAPRTLAVWRKHLPETAKGKIKAEVSKDLTKQAVADLTRTLTGVATA